MSRLFQSPSGVSWSSCRPSMSFPVSMNPVMIVPMYRVTSLTLLAFFFFFYLLFPLDIIPALESSNPPYFLFHIVFCISDHSPSCDCMTMDHGAFCYLCTL